MARWRAALTFAAQQALPARWRSTLAALESARGEYRRLRAGRATDSSALRKAARRIRDLEQLCTMLARELALPRASTPS